MSIISTSEPTAGESFVPLPKGPTDIDAYREELKEEATRLQGLGFVVTVARGKSPHTTMGKGWQSQRLTSDDAANLIDKCALPAIGVLAGTDSGVGDVDIDGDDEREAFLELFDNEPLTMPTCRTGRPGGERRIFAFNQRLANTGKATITFKAENGNKVTLRLGSDSKACQSIWPPSYHFDRNTGTWSGARYEWLPGCSIDDIDPPELPESVVEKLLAQAATPKPLTVTAASAPSTRAPANLPAVVEAMRRCTKRMEDGTDGSKRLFVVCCRAVEFDLSETDAISAVRQYEVESPFPRGYTDEEVLARLHDAASSAGVERGSATVVRRPLTDLGNGERFAARYGASVRYIASWGKWLSWDGRRWLTDQTGEVMRYAKRTTKEIHAETVTAEDDDEAKQITKHAMQSQSRPRLEAMLALAKSEEPIATTTKGLDADAWLLNCESGTVDLTTGEQRAHNPGDQITKTTGIDYFDGEGWDAPLWEEFLYQIFDEDSDLIGFVQRLMGCALVGEQIEHLLPIFWGSGANGKSVFTGAVQHALGEYATTAAPSLFMVKRGESHPTELADLFGRRLVVLNETSDGSRLNEGVVKSITGGDAIKARRMREDFWEFKPSHLPIVVTNHKPIINGTDFGIWRRLRLVPFTVTIPAEEQDKRLPEKLRAEAPGILRWMVEGCIAWQRDGLSEPDAVKVATNAYKSESDTFASWVSECCVVYPDCRGGASELLRSHNEWAIRVHERVQKQTWLAKRLEEKGYTKTRTAQGVTYEGIGLSAD